jgi:hypothetical protein
MDGNGVGFFSLGHVDLDNRFPGLTLEFLHLDGM